MLNPSRQLSFLSYPARSLIRLLSEFDVWLILAPGFLLFVGLTTLKHSGYSGDFYVKQLDFVWAGLVAFVVFWRTPYLFWTHKRVVPILYGVNLGLLLAVMYGGHSALGAQRWLSLGPLRLQPSEIAKLVVIFTLAAWLRTRPIRSFADVIKVAGLILPPAVLVFKQPDLGTSLTFGAL